MDSWKLEDEEDDEELDEVAAVGVEVEDAAAAPTALEATAAALEVSAEDDELELEFELEPEELDTVPGLETWSTNCVPSAIGPDGFAGHDPAGLTAEVMPNGIVPASPTARLPTKVVSEAPWN